MSSTKNHIAKGLGASALAAATIVSGLSFGAGAATAATGSSTTPRALEASTTYTPFFMNVAPETVSGRWYSLDLSSVTNDSPYWLARAADEAAASAGAQRLSVPERDRWLQLHVEGTERCLISQGSGLYMRTCDATDAEQRWKLDDEGHVINKASRLWMVDTYETSHIDGRKVAAVTAGTGSPTFELGDGWPSDSSATLSAEAAFASDVDERATITGDTVAGGTVEVRENGKRIAFDTADADGSFSIPIDAPNTAGDRKLQVALVENGTDKRVIDVTAAYGAGVAITDPADQSDVSGTYDVRGTAQPGAEVTLRVGSTQQPVTLDAQGQWSRSVTLPMGETTITATAKSKGANTTTSTVTVNPGESSTAPLVIQTPADNSTVETESNSIEFAGTGQPGARVQVRTQSATPRTIVDTTVREDGTWSQQGQNLAFDVAYVLDTVYTPRGEAPVTGTHRVTLKDADPGVTRPFAFTTPRDGSTVVAPDGRVRLAGEGTTGTTVTVWNYVSKDRVIGTATVGKDGTWEIAAGAFNNQDTLYDLHVEYTAPNQATEQLTHTITVRAQDGVVQPFDFTTPAEDSTVIAPDHRVDFAGRGTTGGRVVIWNAATRDRVVASTSVKADGSWAASGQLNNANGEYDLHVEYTAPGQATAESSRHIFIKAENSTERPFEMTTPAEGSTVTLSNGRTPVEGFGTTGGTVKVWNWHTKDRIVIEGREFLTVDETGRWAGVGEFAAQDYALHVEYFAPGADLDGEPTQVLTRNFTASATK